MKLLTNEKEAKRWLRAEGLRDEPLPKAYPCLAESRVAEDGGDTAAYLYREDVERWMKELGIGDAKDSARLDFLERDANDEPLLIHNLPYGAPRLTPRGLGLACTGRTLRKAIDDLMYVNGQASPGKTH